jgi:hypothetical protein
LLLPWCVSEEEVEESREGDDERDGEVDNVAGDEAATVLRGAFSLRDECQQRSGVPACHSSARRGGALPARWREGRRASALEDAQRRAEEASGISCRPRWPSGSVQPKVPQRAMARRGGGGTVGGVFCSVAGPRGIFCSASLLMTSSMSAMEKAAPSIAGALKDVSDNSARSLSKSALAGRSRRALTSHAASSAERKAYVGEGGKATLASVVVVRLWQLVRSADTMGEEGGTWGEAAQPRGTKISRRRRASCTRCVTRCSGGHLRCGSEALRNGGSAGNCNLT